MNIYRYEEWYKYEYIENLIHKIYRHIIYNNDKETEEIMMIEYDESGNEIYHHDTHYDTDFDKGEQWCEYDKKNRLIYSKIVYWSETVENWWKYDDNNNLIYHKDTDRGEEWWEYDDNNRIIYYKNSDGYIEYPIYNKDEKIIYTQNSSGEILEEFKYDKNGNQIYFKNSKSEEWSTYDKNNNLIHVKTSSKRKNKIYNTEENYIYDKNSNIIYQSFLDSKGDIKEEWWEYDDKNNPTYYKFYKTSYEEE